ncbi:MULTISPECIES: hypothetical protein [unclassified Pseudoclavibacter]|uniref:hypothetical protein n=1 Tax=unclassified Pseudoclavibacter TaxID=2615177 RepID=UPI001BA7E043|nr:hypothetical protein [Pseudoclavibacter sp. Marseille-Q4354]MBS3177737.1 hypothetical protein [Pseudoclavibacter sp. Marseille-Q4354]
MSSGQRQRTPAEFPRMKYRARARHARSAREAERAQQATDAVAEIPGLTKVVAAALDVVGEVFSGVGRALAGFADALRPPQDRKVVLGFDGSSDRGAMLATIQGGMNLQPDRWVVPFSVDEPSSAIPAGPVAPAIRPASSMVEMWRESPARVEAIEHNQERYRQLMNLRRGQSSTYNQTEYR